MAEGKPMQNLTNLLDAIEASQAELDDMLAVIYDELPDARLNNPVGAVLLDRAIDAYMGLVGIQTARAGQFDAAMSAYEAQITAALKSHRRFSGSPAGRS
jgi:hypothetical protein